MINSISLCGLCHDLGKAPFSKSFNEFYKKKKGVVFD